MTDTFRKWLDGWRAKNVELIVTPAELTPGEKMILLSAVIKHAGKTAEESGD